MHTLLLLISFGILYLALKREFRKIEKTKTWMHRSGLACYILCSAALFLLAVTLNFWVMNLTGCIAFHPPNWDTVTSLTVGTLLWVLLGGGICRACWGQWKVHKVIKLVSPCEHPQVLKMVEILAKKLRIQAPRLATFHSGQPYAASLFWKKPVILLSSWMLETLDEEELETVLAHEMAHMYRRDNRMVLLGGILKDVLFFLPTIRQTWQKFLIDLETAADDVAVLVTEKPAALASAIVRVHRERPKMAFSYGISYFTPDYQQIEERVERLLSDDIHREAKAATVPFSALLFSQDILMSACLMIGILSGIFFLPYCHWLVQTHLV